ncbi:MAG: OmpA family protein, partial [Rudanella sp.]|nr:OmpA family protein [Rudanella sp.]
MTTKGILLASFVFGFFTPSLYAQSKAENLGPQVNSEYNEINPVISPDGKTLYYARISHPQNTHGDKGSQDIWYSEKDPGGQWGPGRRMAFPLNKEDYNCLYSITPDGSTMLVKGAYVSGNYETRGFSLSKRTANGWDVPKKINLPGYEGMSKGQFHCGFLSSDGKT